VAAPLSSALGCFLLLLLLLLLLPLLQVDKQLG
jgi:hypothetical protein